jgi:hypothetical protein
MLIPPHSSTLERCPLMRNVILAFDDLATEVLLAKVPCEECGKCADTMSPCPPCFHALHATK